MKEKMKQLKEYVKTHKKEIIITATGALVVVGAGFGLHKLFSEDTSVEPVVFDLNDLGLLGQVLQVEAISNNEYLYYPAAGEKTFTIGDLGAVGADLVKNYPDVSKSTDEITGLLIMTK